MARNFPQKRMLKQWTSIPGRTDNLAADTTVGIGGFTPGEPVTVLRMLGSYTITPRLAPVAIDEVDIGIAIGVVSLDAFTAGGASLPDPLGNPEYPWLFWVRHGFFFATTSADPSSAAGSVRQSFDIRSMRKMKPNETLVRVVQYGNVTGNPDMMILNESVRVLVAT